MGSRGRSIHNVVSICAIFGACISPSLADTTDPPEIIDFNFWYEALNKEVHVRLVPTETFLANEHVPVWITSQLSDSADSPLILQNTMQELGSFTAYWDHDTCSAALYFHKTQQLEGTIGNHHVIHNLRYNPITKMVELSQDTLFESTSLKHYQYRDMSESVADTEEDKVPSLRAYPETVYIETLVMVENDITADLENDYASIVTYVGALMNSVDMLYSKIEIPNIRINIAGIIIATVPFPRFTSECYGTVQTITDIQFEVLYDQEAMGAITSTLRDYEHHIPNQSYDIVVYLTRSRLFGRNPPISLAGFAGLPPSDYKRRISDVGIAVISEPRNFENFPSVAHEMAHLLGAPHDGGPLSTENGSCIANLMRSPVSYCQDCMKFGGGTPEYLKTFFGTRNACIFHNKPRSLNNPQEPQLFWKPREQCECYGYKSVHRPRNRIRIPFFRSLPINCQSDLMCKSDDRMIHSTNVYMDGTPCAKNRHGRKVCWDGRCVPLRTNSRRN